MSNPVTYTAVLPVAEETVPHYANGVGSGTITTSAR